MLNEADVRRQKAKSLQDEGIQSYPSSSHRTATCGDALTHFDTWQEEQKIITFAGRLLTIRVHGALIFADLQDSSDKIQLLFKQDVIGEASFVSFRDRLDPADFVEVTGTLFATKRGEKTMLVSTWTILSKALRPLPEKWHGLKDPELRYRYRELDLISNPEVMNVFRARSRVIRAFRRALDEAGFEEVETPILQPIPGGTTARPFVTHHNALDLDMYLRIAPELYLKRLIVGGYEKVYEIGKQFRNEGIDWGHNPEFTELEFYWAYQDYHGLMDFTEVLLKKIIQETVGSLSITNGETQIDFSASWPRIRFRDAVKNGSGIDIEGLSREDLILAMKNIGVQTDYSMPNLGALYDDLYKHVVRSNQITPVFIIDYPIEMEPLAKKCARDPRYVERFQLLAAGQELLKAYSELNDPVDQLERFQNQQALREQGDDEAQRIDMAFITSLEHGMPPTAGWGMGIDRFVALLMNVHSVKEVIFFPTLRPEQLS